MSDAPAVRISLHGRLGATVRPYRSAFVLRFLQMLQYRTAALAGFVTQCWWGGIKVMVLTAFYGQAGALSDARPPDAQVPMALDQVITYVWMAQGLLALLPWSGDPEVGQAVRSGSIIHDRLRPVDTYAFWFVRSAGWIGARVLPRLALMVLFAALLLPLAGLGHRGWQAPPGVHAALAFAVSIILAWWLSAAWVMLLNIATAAALDDRGIQTFSTPAVILLSGNLVPLALFPDAWQMALLLQPFAGLMDIPVRLYTGQLSGGVALAAIGIQIGWLLVLVVAGRRAMRRVMNRLEVQGG